MDRISSRPPEYLSPVHTCMYTYLYLMFNFPACLMRRSVYSEGKHNKKFAAQIAFGALLLLLLLFLLLLLLMLLLATQVFTNFPGTFSLFCPWSAAALFLCNFQIDCKHVTVGQPAPPLIAPPCHAPSLPPTQLIFSHILQQHALTLSVWFGSFRLYDFFACWPAAWHSVTFPLCDLLPLPVPHNPCHAPLPVGYLVSLPPKEHLNNFCFANLYPLPHRRRYPWRTRTNCSQYNSWASIFRASRELVVSHLPGKSNTERSYKKQEPLNVLLDNITMNYVCI